MVAEQLEFNLYSESQEDFKLSSMQKQIDLMNESVGKVRRKLFADMTELKKAVEILKQENHNLSCEIRQLKQEKTEWVYAKEGCLFEVLESKGISRS